MTLSEGMQVAGILVTVLVAWISFLNRRSAKSADDRTERIEASVTAVATDVRMLASTVSGHEARLAVGNEKFTRIETRVDGLEQRERERGCFGHCRVRGDGG